MKTAMAEHDDSFGGRAKESVTGWWGRSGASSPKSATRWGA